ncbi:uncharacterized protein [Branchiostoma lanceolatum]|uniref:uncharacterized protein isoform X3 n=1 Tax=Branchiostoma lanceolatum TaxID=7740 RepID=UPI00345122E5
MAHSAPGSTQENENTNDEESGKIAALISYLRRVRTDMFRQADQAQHCRFCGQQGRCDCQTKRGDDSAIEEDKSDTVEAPEDEAVSAICQVNDTMRQILQEIMEIKQTSHSQGRHVNDVVTHDKYQHVVDDLLVARSRYQELEDRLCWYENTLKSKEEEEKKKKKNLELQITGIPGDGSKRGGANALEHQQENALKSESGLGAKRTDITQVKELMSKLLQEISDMRKNKTERKDTVDDERTENINDSVIDAVMEALDIDEVHVKNYEEERRTSTPLEMNPTKDEDERKCLEMQTSPIRMIPVESSSKELGSHPSNGDRKVRLMADSQVQTIPIPRTREEVLRDLVQSDTLDGVSLAGQEGTMSVQNKTDSDSRMNSQECDIKCEQHLDRNYVPDTVGVTTSCEKIEEKNVTSKGGSLGFFNFGKDAEKLVEEKVEGKVFSSSFFGFGQKAQDQGSGSPVNQITSGFGLESLSKFRSWVGDSIASTAMQLTGRNSDKTTDSMDQRQKQNESVPGQLRTSEISETLSSGEKSGDNPLSSGYPASQQGPDLQVSQAPVNEPPFTATYVTVQTLSPRGTLFHLLQNTDETEKYDSVPSTGPLKSETSHALCQTEVQKREKSGQTNIQDFHVPQTTFTKPVPQERTLQMVDTPPVQRKVMKRSASLPRRAHMASLEPRSAHRHVHNVGVITSTSQQQLQTRPRKGILHQKQHVCEASYNSVLWRRRGSNCVQVDTQEISSDAAASDDSKLSYSGKRQKHVTYSPYVQRKIISPRHSPKDRPKFFIPSLVEYEDSTSASEEDVETMSSASVQSRDYDQTKHYASQKPIARSSEATAGQKKLSSNSSSSPQPSSGLLKKTSRIADDDASSLDHKQASSNFLQVPGTVPSVRPKVRQRLGAEDCSAGRGRSRERISVQQSSRQPTSVQQSSRQPMSVQQSGRQPMSVQQSSRQPMSVQQSSRQPMSVQQSSRQPMSKLQSRRRSVSPSKQTVSSEDDRFIHGSRRPSQVERRSRERESRQHLKNRAQVSMPRTGEGDLMSSHLLKSAAIGKSRKDQTLGVDVETTQGKARSPHLQHSLGSNIRDGAGNVASGTKRREKLQRSSSVGRSRRDKTVAGASRDEDATLNSHSKSRYLHRSRSMDRGKWDKAVDRKWTEGREEMAPQLHVHGSHSLARTQMEETADRTSGTVRATSMLQQGTPNTANRRSRREEDAADMSRALFWSQVAAKSPQLKPRIIHSQQQIYGSAYQVEEETSSDSDDEVLQQYKRSMSQHSVRSKASVRSQRSKKGEQKLASPAEKPEAEAAYQPIEEPDYHRPTSDHHRPTSDYHRPTRAKPDDPYSRLEKGEPEEEMVESDFEPDHAAYLEYEEGLDNEAYDSEGANGAYGDQVSYHSQERRKRLKSRRQRPEGRSMSSHLNKDRGYYDVDQPYDEDSQLISKCGVLEVAFAYDAPNRKMTVSIVQARDVPSKDRGGTGGYQVHMVLLPTKKQRCKTKVRQGNNPVFKESFRFSRVNQDELPDMGVRFRLYACERMKKERLIGEKLVGFSNLKLDQRESMAVTLPLEPRSNLSGGDSQFSLSGLSRSDSGSSSQSLTHAGGVPELLVGLAYNATTGRLSVEVIKGSHFRNMAMNRAPDTYVKICLMASNGQELSRSKTSIRRGQPNPVYKETFIFQVALFQLSDVTLMFSVYNKRGMKRKEMIGWFSLGLNNSGEEELNHWQDMRESKGQQVCRWHVLLES